MQVPDLDVLGQDVYTLMPKNVHACTRKEITLKRTLRAQEHTDNESETLCCSATTLVPGQTFLSHKIQRETIMAFSYHPEKLWLSNKTKLSLPKKKM
ncbi:hypothetical protein CapIbe_004681 [Capra ibex]